MGRSKDYAIVVAGAGDTLASLAGRYLGDARRGWVIADFNAVDRVSPGQEVVVPLAEANPVGVFLEGFQTVPVLCYHRFGESSAKMVVTPQAFGEQMAYLADHGYRVIPLEDLVEFVGGRRALPRKAVVLTMDDGYKSAYRYAYPILRKHGFPATIFVYTDFMGARDALSWEEMKEMAASGLVEFQPHSKSHANLTVRPAGEGEGAYAQRVREEISTPTHLIEERLRLQGHTFAYPYGDANDVVVARLRETGFQLGVTVLPGGNPSFSYPYLLRRTMVFGEDDLEAFRSKLDVFRSR